MCKYLAINHSSPLDVAASSTFSDDSKSFVGTAMTVHGDHVAVTGSVVTLPGDAIDSEDDSEDDAPPAYSLSTKV